MSDVTQLLEALERGEPKAAEELIPLVYDELRRSAARRLARQPPGQTIQATELVHEACRRLLGSPSPGWAGHRHFLAAAAQTMRHILIDRVRRKQQLKHGGRWRRVELDAVELPQVMPDDEVLAMDEALERLETVDPRAATLVKLRFFIGLTQAQSAEALGVSRQAADDLWAFAKLWLFQAVRADLE